MSEENNKGVLDPDIASLLDLDENEFPDEELQKPVEELSNEEFLQKLSQEADLKDIPEQLSIITDGIDIEIVERMLKNKQLFDKATNKEDKGIFRERLAVAYWNFYRLLVRQDIKTTVPEKKLCIRYNLLDNNYISASQKKMIDSIPLNEKISKDENILFVDEWFYKIGTGEISPSIIDETIELKKRANKINEEKLEKKQGALEAELMSIKNKLELIRIEEDSLSEAVATLKDHFPHQGLEDEGDFFDSYTSQQKECLSNIQESCRKLALYDKELASSYRTVDALKQEISELQSGQRRSEDDEKEASIDADVIDYEFKSVRQMIKMCVGRQGNHFPILYEPYFSDSINDMANRQNISKMIQEIERLDPGLFKRTYKGEEHRVVPYFIIVPCYGEYGICWEPFPRVNRATGRGRIAIATFPKNLKFALLTALADLRWQIAKEKAQHRWMEEGLTGKYYEYYQNEKLKGNIKSYFVQDYIKWITFESNGVQKLHKDVRAIFWRLMPFPQEIKEKLKNAGFYYADLYKKDMNIAKSEGYL